MIVGLIVGIIIGRSTEYYTSQSYRPTQKLSESGKTGPATVIISGIGLGMLSTAIPVIAVVGGIIASYLFASDLSELFLDADTSVDFLYLNDYRNPDLLEEVFRVCVHRATPKSVFALHGICYSKEMKILWKKLQTDERVGITFDLYDVGLLFFDKTKIKQQYIVNF